MDGAGSGLIVEDARFEIRLPAFDGPLDLLLHLIRTEALDIFDIPIARLTRTYLASLRAMEALAVEPASEFLVMAATLVQIKSRMLLPRPSMEDIEDAEDPRDALVIQLLEYQRFKAAAGELAERPRLGLDVFSRAPGLDRPPSEETDLPDQSVFRLAEAFRTLVAQGQFDAPHDIYVERISIGERIAQIAERLAAERRVTFSALCEGVRYREEIITTFLALLEMSRLKLVRATQGDRLGPLYIEAWVDDIEVRGEQAAGMLD